MPAKAWIAFAVLIYACISHCEGSQIPAGTMNLFMHRASCPDGHLPLDYNVTSYWSKARQILSLPRKFDPKAETFIRNIYSSLAGYSVSEGSKSIYIHMTSCNSASIRYSLEKAPEFQPVQVIDLSECRLYGCEKNPSLCSKKCQLFKQNGINSTGYFTFTVVNDPLERFLHGYSDIEYRLKDQAELHLLHFEEAGPSFLNLPLGSPERFVDFVKDFLMFRWPAHKPLMQRVFPMSGFLQHVKPDYVGTLEHMKDIWDLVQIQVQHEPLVPFRDIQGGPHQAVPDTHGELSAARQALETYPNIKRALCSLFLIDYACLGYQLPSGCEDMTL